MHCLRCRKFMKRIKRKLMPIWKLSELNWLKSHQSEFFHHIINNNIKILLLFFLRVKAAIPIGKKTAPVVEEKKEQ